MNLETVYILIIVIAVLVALRMYDNCVLKCPNFDRSQAPSITKEDDKKGKDAAKVLEQKLKNGEEIPEVDDKTLKVLAKDIYIIADPNPESRSAASAESDVNSGKEGFSFNYPVNSTFWPYYYYSYHYPAGVWPPGLYNRLYWWSPGFYTTSGWQWGLRPGTKYIKWPYTSWMRNNNKYYYVNNQGIHNKMQDASGY